MILGIGEICERDNPGPDHGANDQGGAVSKRQKTKDNENKSSKPAMGCNPQYKATTLVTPQF